MHIKLNEDEIWFALMPEDSPPPPNVKSVKQTFDIPGKELHLHEIKGNTLAQR